MCGIIGYSGSMPGKDIILNGLSSLEYRGYDSAGLALFINDDFKTVKCSGRVQNLKEKCQKIETDSTCGIGHTRWATHGAPSDVNSHPHSSESCVLVHNGIIENYIEIKRSLQQSGYTFVSETDTECIVHLIDLEYKKHRDPKKAIMYAISKLKGSFAVAVMFKDREGEIWGFRRDNPLIATCTDKGTFLASDIPALLCYSNSILRPADNEMILLNGQEITLFDSNGDEKKFDYEIINWSIGTAQKDGFDHFMLKEIYEQPKAVKRTFSSFLGENGLPDLSSIGIEESFLKSIDSISVIGCGSATHAGFVGKQLIEKIAKIPVFVTTASEYRYSPPVTLGNSLVISVSQSGETADTLAALRLAKSMGYKSLGIINAVGSAIARDSDYVMYTNAGPEIAVATTKGYTTQLTAFVVIALALGIAKKSIDENYVKNICKDMCDSIPNAITQIIGRRDEILKIAKTLVNDDDLYFIGRGIDNYASIECSLKLKEISYIHSEAYAAGELKHGTLSLIEEDTPVIAISSDKAYFEKMLGNIREVMSRGGKVILICNKDFPDADENSYISFALPPTPSELSPLTSVVVCQLLAYEVALLRGCDVDHPRNLAKSVTVE